MDDVRSIAEAKLREQADIARRHFKNGPTGPKRSEHDDRRTAFHEAGHAVCALMNGEVVRAVHIVGHDGEQGECWVVRLTDFHYLDLARSLAGLMAESWGVGDFSDDGELASDKDGAGRAFEAIADEQGWQKDDANFQAIIDAAEARLKPYRPQVERLAEELLKRRMMTGEEVKTLLGEFTTKELET